MRAARRLYRPGPVARLFALAALAAAGSVLVMTRTTAGGPAVAPRAPDRLAATGLYADTTAWIVRADNLPYEPQYPLWSDGATKRRWIHLPPGSFIDASDPGHWRFPVGTRLWKEFSFGRRVETRYMELGQDGNWVFASYAWNQDGTAATLAPQRGLRGVCEIRPGVPHDIPGYYDCLACHEGQPNRVLGFSALQLSPDRDPLAPHAQVPGKDDIDLRWLVARGLVRGLPPSFAAHPPRIEAPTPEARAAIGYLHGNCAGCHNEEGPLATLGFSLEVALTKSGKTDPRVFSTAVDHSSKFHPPGFPEGFCARIASRDPAHSVAIARISSRDPSVQMPPLGTRLADEEAIRLITAWIRDGLRPQSVTSLTTEKP